MDDIRQAARLLVAIDVKRRPIRKALVDLIPALLADDPDAKEKAKLLLAELRPSRRPKGC